MNTLDTHTVWIAGHTVADAIVNLTALVWTVAQRGWLRRGVAIVWYQPEACCWVAAQVIVKRTRQDEEAV